MIVSLKNPNCIDPISQPEADIGLEGPVPQVVKRRRYRLVMVYSSGDLLHLKVFEVKKNMLPWDAKSRPPNKKAENQLTEDVDILVALLAGTPPDQIVIAILL